MSYLVLIFAAQFSDYELVMRDAVHLEELGELTRAAERYEDAAHITRDLDERAAAFLAAGRVRTLNAQDDLADIDFYLVIKIQPYRQILDDEDPTVIARFERVRADIAADPRAAEDAVVEMIRVRRRAQPPPRPTPRASNGLSAREFFGYGLVATGVCLGTCGGLFTLAAINDRDDANLGAGLTLFGAAALVGGTGIVLLLLPDPEPAARAPPAARDDIREQLRALTGQANVAMAF